MVILFLLERGKGHFSGLFSFPVFYYDFKKSILYFSQGLVSQNKQCGQINLDKMLFLDMKGQFLIATYFKIQFTSNGALRWGSRYFCFSVGHNEFVNDINRHKLGIGWRRHEDVRHLMIQPRKKVQSPCWVVERAQQLVCLAALG